MNNRQPERCYCGDPECEYCFPFSRLRPERDEDAEYEIMRQQQIDDQAQILIDIARTPTEDYNA